MNDFMKNSKTMSAQDLQNLAQTVEDSILHPDTKGFVFGVMRNDGKIGLQYHNLNVDQATFVVRAIHDAILKATLTLVAEEAHQKTIKSVEI